MVFCQCCGKWKRRCSSSAITIFGPVKAIQLPSWMDSLGGRPRLTHAYSCEEDFEDACFKEHQGVSGTLASLLRRYGRAKELSQGHLVHTQIIMLGYEETTFIANSMIEMYGNCGHVEDAKALFEKLGHPNVYSFNIVLKTYSRNRMLDLARELFWKMSLRDVVSWSTMIGSLSQSGHYGEALDAYCQMVLGPIKPDNITFVCVLNACSNLLLLKEGIEVHASIVAQRFESDVVVGTALINMYGKCGQVLYAVNVFNHMTIHDTVCWNALLTVYSQNNYSQAALSLFKTMLNEGIKPTNVSFLSAIDACAGLCLLEEGQRIHAIINNSGVSEDSTLHNALLNMYGKCGSLYLAGFIFESMPCRDIISWNSMIAILSQNGKNHEALSLYDNMIGGGVGPDNMTFASALNACASLEASEEGQIIHNTIVIDHFHCDNMVEIALINMYGRCSCLHSAQRVFWKMVSQGIVAWNVMIAALIHHNHCEDALRYFHVMLNKGILPDDITYASILDACALVNGLLLGQQVHTALIYLGYRQDSFIETSLVSMYGRCGDLLKAKTALDSFSFQTLAPINAYLSVLLEKGRYREVLDFFRSLLSSGIRPDVISCLHAINACSSIVVFADGKKIHDIISGLKYEQDLVVGTALINMYGKCGSLHYARSVFGKIRPWDLVVCNAMTCAHAENGYIEGAVNIFLKMLGEGIKPNQVTFISILTACSHTGEVELGRHLFVSMRKDHGLKHLEDHYVCMLDILGRAGNLDEAEQLIRSRPCGVSSLMWLTLLGACQMHGDMEKGWLSARACSELDPGDASHYILMSNICIAAGMRHC